MRAADQIQTYCFAPGNVLVHNSINTVHNQVILPYEWCVATPGCTYSTITWWFNVLPAGGIGYQYSVNSGAIVAGTLTGIYGVTGCLPLKLPWSGVATNLDGDKVPASVYRSGANLCQAWWGRDKAGGWTAQNECGGTLVNIFRMCGSTLMPLSVE